MYQYIQSIVYIYGTSIVYYGTCPSEILGTHHGVAGVVSNLHT